MRQKTSPKMTNLTTYQARLKAEGLNSRHQSLPDELKVAISKSSTESVDYAFYEKFKHLYSSIKLKVRYVCEECESIHTTDFKHLNKRKVVSRAICPKCVMKIAGLDEGWRKRNSEAQLKIQSTPGQKAKNAAGVSEFWKNNPEKLESMRQTLLTYYESDIGKNMIKRRQLGGNYRRGISGDYLSRWGWTSFESSYELLFIIEFEKRSDVASVRRGPIIKYDYEGVARQYFMDFEVKFESGEIWWVEIKSSYIGKNRHSIGKLREKLTEALRLAKSGHANKVLMITEKSSKRILGVPAPRGSSRVNLLRDNYDKIIFLNPENEEKYR